MVRLYSSAAPCHLTSAAATFCVPHQNLRDLSNPMCFPFPDFDRAGISFWVWPAKWNATRCQYSFAGIEWGECELPCRSKTNWLALWLVKACPVAVLQCPFTPFSSFPAGGVWNPFVSKQEPKRSLPRNRPFFLPVQTVPIELNRYNSTV